jgi:hypothetical protein
VASSANRNTFNSYPCPYIHCWSGTKNSCRTQYRYTIRCHLEYRSPDERERKWKHSASVDTKSQDFASLAAAITASYPEDSFGNVVGSLRVLKPRNCKKEIKKIANEDSRDV